MYADYYGVKNHNTVTPKSHPRPPTATGHQPDSSKETLQMGKHTQKLVITSRGERVLHTLAGLTILAAIILTGFLDGASL